MGNEVTCYVLRDGHPTLGFDPACSYSVHREPNKKAMVPICKVFVSHGQESNSRAEALTTRPRAGYN